MNTKIIICLLTTAQLSTVPFVEAQQSRIYRVGMLAPPGKVEESRNTKGLRAGLAEAGYVEGKNLQLNIPNVKTYDELRPIAKDYVEKKADVIVTQGGTATAMAREATKEIPIVFIWGNQTHTSRIRTVSGASGGEYYGFELLR
jgi:putative tryptophan/tyrosine transport system substrate-binding protein